MGVILPFICGVKNGGPCHATAPSCDIAIKSPVLLLVVLPRHHLFVLLCYLLGRSHIHYVAKGDLELWVLFLSPKC